MKRRFAVLFACFVVVLVAIGWCRSTEAVLPVSLDHTLVIDAGHGGEDGGAISLTGVPESQINLEIALKLEDILALHGLPPKMLRRTDISLHDSDTKTLREKKRSDLKNRVKMIEETPSPFLISLHQNSYPEQKYYGAQVFYTSAPGTKEIALEMQEALGRGLDTVGLRKAKPISDHVYLLNHVACPAILVECGFLTNPTEEKLLRQASYQKKLAAILAGVLLNLPEFSSNTQEPLL